MAVDLGKEIGPLPLGAWIAVVGGGMGIVLIRRRSTATPQSTVVDNTSGDPGVGTGPSWTTIAPPSTSSTSQGQTYVNNSDWSVGAINWLLAKGMPAGSANNAITKGLSGGVGNDGSGMTIDEWSLWQIAIAGIGPPPQPVNVPPPSTVGSTVSLPPPPPAHPIRSGNIKYYTVQPGDSLASISTHFYGTSTKGMNIFNANRADSFRVDGSKGFMVFPVIAPAGIGPGLAGNLAAKPGDRLIIP